MPQIEVYFSDKELENSLIQEYEYMEHIKCWLSNVLPLAEFIYYIAFCVLTWLLYLYAKRTYMFATEPITQLFCKLYIPDSEHGKVEQLLYLEIYNSGNTVAKNIQIKFGGGILAKVDFIKPEESYKLLIGNISRMIGCNRMWIQDTEVSATETPKVIICDDSMPEKEFELDTSAYFLHNDVLHDEAKRISVELHEMNSTIKKAFDCQYIGPGHTSFRDELNRIANELAKK